MKISPVVILLGIPLVVFIVATAAAIVLFEQKIVTPPIGWLIFGGGTAVAIGLFVWLGLSKG